MKCYAVLEREGHLGQHVVFAVAHDLGELGPAGVNLICQAMPRFCGVDAVRLLEGLFKADLGARRSMIGLSVRN